MLPAAVGDSDPLYLTNFLARSTVPHLMTRMRLDTQSVL